MNPREVLPLINAVIVSASGLLIVLGLLEIRRGRRDRHQRAMLGATVLALVFLVLYVYRIAAFGLTPFPGPDWAKRIYLWVLFSHILLAVVSTPFVAVTLYRAWRGQFGKHRRVARWTYPMWLYVSATGPLVYWMLYRWF